MFKRLINATVFDLALDANDKEWFNRLCVIANEPASLFPIHERYLYLWDIDIHSTIYSVRYDLDAMRYELIDDDNKLYIVAQPMNPDNSMEYECIFINVDAPILACEIFNRIYSNHLKQSSAI